MKYKVVQFSLGTVVNNEINLPNQKIIKILKSQEKHNEYGRYYDFECLVEENGKTSK